MNKKEQFLIDTLKHQKRVHELLIRFAQELLSRALKHDESKLSSPEKECFEKITGQRPSYGTDEYIEMKKTLGEGLIHHYKNNDHHPEHFKEGIEGMNLFQLVEMLLDWVAASERGGTDLEEAIKIGVERFKISPQLAEILQNTVKSL